MFTWLAKGMVARDCLETTDVQTHHVAAKMGPVAMHEHASEDRGRQGERTWNPGKIGQLETPLGSECHFAVVGNAVAYEHHRDVGQYDHPKQTTSA